jgi:hypothetical protein
MIRAIDTLIRAQEARHQWILRAAEQIRRDSRKEADNEPARYD